MRKIETYERFHRHLAAWVDREIESWLAQDMTRPRFTSPRGVERAIGPAVLRAHDFVAEHACVC